MLHLLEGKKGLIMGLANERSIAFGAAQILSKHNAKLCFSYPSETIEKRVKSVAKSLGHNSTFFCDVTDSDSIKQLFKSIKEDFGTLDFLVHSIAFSDKKELDGPYLNTSLNNFITAMHISCYSFTEIIRESRHLMNKGASYITMSYYGSTKVVPHYNVMGLCKSALECSVRYLSHDLGPDIRVNAISAGPMKTLASSGINGMRYILKWNALNSPLKRNTSLEDVGNASLFLASELSSGITGDVLYVDSGYHTVGMKAVDAPDISIVENDSNT